MRKKGGAIGFAVYLDELERRAAPKAVYDVDTVLLYEPETGVAGVAAAVEELTAAGQSVLALPRDDGTIRRRKTLKIGRKGLESVESHG